jgi:hypothetical protein
MSDDAWAIAFADHLARCGRDASVHTGHSWLVTVLAEISSEIRGASSYKAQGRQASTIQTGQAERQAGQTQGQA